MTIAEAREIRASPFIIVALFGMGAAVAATAIYSALDRLQPSSGRQSPEATGPSGPARMDSASAQSVLVRAREDLREDPLAPRPFVMASRAAEARGDVASAIIMMEQARTRDPRNVFARWWLTDRYLRAERFGDTVVELDALMRIRPALLRQLVAVLVPLLNEPGARHEISEAIAVNPVWKDDFIDLARRDDRAASVFYGLMYNLGGIESFTLSDAQLSAIVASALARGDYRAASALYSRYVQRTAIDPSNLVYDGDFRGAPGPAPFNWTLVNSQSGSAQIDNAGNRGRLTARTFGGGSAMLAAQTILLTPGIYIMSASGAVDVASPPEDLSWQLLCDRTSTQLGVLAIAVDQGARIAQEVRFEVPANCPSTTLQLIYAPTGRGAFGAMAFDNIRLERVGSVAQ